MTKVEELREGLVDAEYESMKNSASYMQDMGGWNGHIPTRKEAKTIVDSFAALIHAEGVAEERERIRRAGDTISIADVVTGENKYGAWSKHEVNGNPEPRGSFMCMVSAGEYVLIPASLLAPDKESEK